MATSQSNSEICPACGQTLNRESPCCSFAAAAPGEPPPLKAEIELLASGQLVPVQERWLRIGRDGSNQIVLDDDQFVSRYHAWVTFEQDRFWLEDLGSTNGTQLNGQTLERREVLASGDLIKIGESEMVFRLLPEPAGE